MSQSNTAEHGRQEYSGQKRLAQTIGGMGGSALVFLGLFVRLIRRPELRDRRWWWKLIAFLVLVAGNAGLTFLLVKATKGYLSMLVAAVNWSVFQHLPRVYYDMLGPLTGSLLVTLVTTLPVYILLRLVFRVGHGAGR